LSVGDIDVSSGINGYSCWGIELGICCYSTIAGVAGNTSASNGSNVSSYNVHFADYIVIGVRNIDVPRGVERNSGWSVQLGPYGRSTVTRITGCSIARNNCYYTG